MSDCSTPQSVTAYRGDYTEIDLALVDRSNNAIDLTDAEVYFTVKSSAADSDKDAVFQLSKENDGIIDVDYSSGKCRALITGEDTIGMNPGSYVFDVKVEEEGDRRQTLIFGTFLLWPVSFRGEEEEDG